MVEYHPISAQDLSRLHQFGPKVLPGIFLGYALHAGESGKETSWSQTLRNWHPKSIQKRLNAKDVLTLVSGEKFIFPIADGTVKLSAGDQVLRTSTLILDRPDPREEHGNLPGESDGSSSTPLRDSSWCNGDARNDFGPFQAILFTVITWNPESNCACWEKNHFLFH